MEDLVQQTKNEDNKFIQYIVYFNNNIRVGVGIINYLHKTFYSINLDVL